MTEPMQPSTNRRAFLSQLAAATGAIAAPSFVTLPNGVLSAPVHANEAPSDTNVPAKPKVGVIFTELRFRSHAFNILENFLGPYLFRGKMIEPPVEVVSLYADQFPSNDMARDVARRYRVPLYPSIDAALCCGRKELAVDAVLSIVEHGEYPTNARGQKLYPRKQFFDAAVAVMRRSQRFVPLFNDKHLSYSWEFSKQMYDTARELGVPLMAGSSVPLAQRRPPLEIPAGQTIEEAVAVHGGGIEVYDFHGLELLQSMIESRRGGETGIRQVEFLQGDAVWRAAREGRWSKSLADAAMAAELGHPLESYDSVPGDKGNEPPHLLLVTYRDGTRGAVLKVGQSSNRWNFACRLAGDSAIRATSLFNGPWGNRNLFQALSHSIQEFFVRRRAPYPVERTLLVGGSLDAAMTSREQASQPVATPFLEFAYEPRDFTAFRENGESWRVLPPGSPEPKDMRAAGKE